MERGQLLPSLLDRGPGRQPADSRVRPAVRVGGVPSEGNPDVGSSQKARLGGKDTDDLGLGPVQPDRPAQDVGIPRELPCPEPVGEEGHRCGVGDIVGRKDEATQGGSQVENVVQVVRHQEHGDALGRVVGGEVGAAEVEESHRFEGLGVLAPHGEVREGDADELQAPLGGGLVQIHQAMGLRKRKRLEEEAVEDPEDGGVARDAYAHQQHDHGGVGR